jgi:ribonucleoside-diphosphate reductase alpha chain
MMKSDFVVNGKIMPERDSLYDSVGMQRMRDSYLAKGEVSPQERLWNVSHTFADDEAHGNRLYEYASRHWLSYSSPILSFDKARYKHALPISCYLVYVEDSIKGLIKAQSEVCQLSVLGGGVSVYLGALRANTISHIKVYDSAMLAYKQTTRRGAFCMYLDVNHPDVEMFIDIRKATGDDNQRARNVHHALNISDAFMQKVQACLEDSTADDSWDLICPKTKRVVNTVSAKALFEQIITTRLQTGEPFLCFTDACNRGMNPYQKAKGMTINQSNLCTEIIVPTGADRSSMCCIATLNLLYFDEYSTDPELYYMFINDVMRMLDNVLTVFGEGIKDNEYVRRMLGALEGERNIAIGVMGLHSYAQTKSVAMDDREAFGPINRKIFSSLHEHVQRANKELGAERGSPSDIAGSGDRFAYTIGLPPTATSSIIVGNTSPGIEPVTANAYVQNTLSGNGDMVRNPHLQRLFESKGLHPNRIAKLWKRIVTDRGSVRNIGNAFLTPHERDVFKTWDEMDQTMLVENAIERQPYIDQGQSLTVKFTANDPDILSMVRTHMRAWEGGLKTMYYMRSTKAMRPQNLSVLDDKKEEESTSACTSCEG